MNAREEAILERDVLRAIGLDPGLALYRNEVGAGFTGNVFHLINDPVTRGILQRHRIVWGLGVGSPDLAGSLDGRAFYLELKSPKGRVEPEQERWHAAARAKGAFVAVVRSPIEAAAALDRSRKGAPS